MIPVTGVSVGTARGHTNTIRSTMSAKDDGWVAGNDGASIGLVVIFLSCHIGEIASRLLDTEALPVIEFFLETCMSTEYRVPRCLLTLDVERSQG